MANIPGTPGNDTLNGTPEDDQIDGQEGNDLIQGDVGSDLIFGGLGNDTINGDTILIADTLGNDTIYGEDGDDYIRGRGGSDHIDGGAGNDVLVATDTTSSWGYLETDFDELLGGEGNDVAYFNGSRGSFDGGTGDDSIRFFDGIRVGNTFSGEPQIVTSGTSGSFISNGETIVTWENVEHIMYRGSSGNENIQTSDGNDDIQVRDGANTVSTGAGNDTVSYFIGQANDLDGGEGYDVLIIGSGYEDMSGFVDLRDPDNIQDGYGSALLGFEEISYSASYYDDKVVLGAEDDTLNGGNGNDVLRGWRGNDDLSGDIGFDILSGGQGFDTLKGGDGNDILRGGDGADVLDGGQGNDRMWGGPGADTFVFELFAGVDHIADFRSGLDQIQIDQLVIPGQQELGPVDPTLFSSGAPVGTHGQFVLVDDGGVSPTLLWDGDGTGGRAGVTMLTLGSGLTMDASDILFF